MISNPDFIYYACIARATTILAQHTSKEQPNMEDLAAQCVAQAPPNHSMFSHTVKKRTYTFLMDAPFVYFAIFDEQLVKSEALRFLNHIRCAFREVIGTRSVTGSDNFTPLCLQSQLDSIFRETMGSDLDSTSSLRGGNADSGKSCVDSARGKRSSTVPLLEKPIEGLKKKKRVAMEANGIEGKDAATEKKLDVCDEINGCNRDFSLAVPKGMVNDHRQKAKLVWKKHVWVVLLLDVFVCAVLFVIWLWVCRGFKCMAH